MMDAVKIIECPRDAWQGLKRQIPTLQKVEYLRRLVDAGFRHIDAVSFVSPKVVPQMADSEAVVEQLGPLEGVEIIGIVVNEKGRGTCDRDRSGEHTRLSLFHFGDLSAQKSKSIAGGKCGGAGKDQGLRG